MDKEKYKKKLAEILDEFFLEMTDGGALKITFVSGEDHNIGVYRIILTWFRPDKSSSCRTLDEIDHEGKPFDPFWMWLGAMHVMFQDKPYRMNIRSFSLDEDFWKESNFDWYEMLDRLCQAKLG